VPIYDYTCSACGRRTEFIHGIYESSPKFCPACGAEDTLRKDFSMPSVHFKGSGWAKKDRSASASRASKAADGDSSADAGKGAADKGDSDKGGADKGGADKSAKSDGGSDKSATSDRGSKDGAASSKPARSSSAKEAD